MATTRYESAVDRHHHDHLICQACGKIIEFENDRIEVLQDAVARKHGFTVLHHKLELYGRCRDCSVSGPRRRLIIRRMRRLGGLGSIVLVAALAGCAHNPLGDIDAANLALEDTQGGRVHLSSYQGRVVLVNFFATWCFFCLGDIPRLEALQESRAAEGLQVVGVGLDREAASAAPVSGLLPPDLPGADRRRPLRR